MMEAEEEPGRTLIGRRTLIGLLAGVLLLVGVVAAGVWLISEKADGPIDVPPEGEVPLVRSPGPWKVDATGPGTEGKPVEGQGQLLFPTGEGMEPDAPLAVERLPEEPALPAAVAPVPATGAPIALLPEDEEPARPEPAPAPASRTAVPAEPARPEPARPAPDMAVPPAPAGGLAGTVQLGAFSSEAAARKAWEQMTARFPWLEGYGQLILPVPRDGQATLYRLRARGPDPKSVCDRLRVAGEECAVVR
jgi:cell division septation protein DedD